MNERNNLIQQFKRSISVWKKINITSNHKNENKLLISGYQIGEEGKKKERRKEGRRGRVPEYKDQSCHQRTWDNPKCILSYMVLSITYKIVSPPSPHPTKSKINQIEPEYHQAFRSNHQFIRVKKEGKGDKLHNSTMD